MAKTCKGCKRDLTEKGAVTYRVAYEANIDSKLPSHLIVHMLPNRDRREAVCAECGAAVPWKTVRVMAKKNREYVANAADCDIVLHGHLNSHKDAKANYCLVLIARPLGRHEVEIAEALSHAMARVSGTSLGWGRPMGVKVLKDGDRGEYAIDDVEMGMILEPGFGSNRYFSTWVRKAEHRALLGEAIADVVRAAYPDGATVGLSVGHKYKTSNPRDRGAMLYPHDGVTEADIAESYLLGIVDALAEESESEEEEDMRIEYDHRKITVHLGEDEASDAAFEKIKKVCTDHSKAMVVSQTYRDSFKGWVGEKVV